MPEDNSYHNPSSRLMSLAEVTEATTMSRFLIAALAKEGHFPKPIQLTVKRIAFVRAEVDSWIDERIATRK
ncbi:helix-turn-helix transcriptional regulator [Ochrobactrum chromiisoli]|uniref:AlpA family phage regulatory protein n=1 Tax=Ochrobactrum chromiisoli TaxID=2993941 RepID=A0ABT3QKM4_9HYPH|nr:AlpA family phage regulatory protein [Ochrobactrum chromiisoli]MCX2696151.1 AlpA family phage regulatory protein [Ochrobactrum chromiisoli]